MTGAEFIKSAASFGDCIVSGFPQIAVAGRSNVGKSSVINLIVNNARLARTSKEPGRTRHINYFLIEEKYFLADLPGYGYARVSQAEKNKWAELIEAYLEKEKMLAHVFFLADIRHDPTRDDVTMYEYLFRNNISFTLVATKADKIAKSKVAAAKNRLAAFFKLGRDNIIATSATTKQGRGELLARIEQIISAAQAGAKEEGEAEDGQAENKA